MISEEIINKAVTLLKNAAPDATIILFGSHARGAAQERSDVDFMVVGPEVKARRAEMVRLLEALRPLRLEVDVLVASKKTFEEWSKAPGTVYYNALNEGKVVYDPEKAH